MTKPAWGFLSPGCDLIFLTNCPSDHGVLTPAYHRGRSIPAIQDWIFHIGLLMQLPLASFTTFLQQKFSFPAPLETLSTHSFTQPLYKLTEISSNLKRKFLSPAILLNWQVSSFTYITKFRATVFSSSFILQVKEAKLNGHTTVGATVDKMQGCNAFTILGFPSSQHPALSPNT